ncbi:hypothetical protein [Sphingobacterium hungaricum]|uniref:Uncharacterized protein n=1 Tax=Sphingobacterium hungaricum TaxID=2082723 RepID=A0A928UST2_9SPHI|nr:hypothetical protein [Sphingobacterium hungaricum]MBE8712087.1 hypothetical protein [Sphingobacterium hungaricum]
MKTQKKVTEVSKAKAPVEAKKVAVKPKVSVTEKATPALAAKFEISKTVKPEDIEIRIKFKGEEMVASFYDKGQEVGKQTVIIKPKPRPPITIDDVLNSVNNLKLNLKIKK